MIIIKNSGVWIAIFWFNIILLSLGGYGFGYTVGGDLGGALGIIMGMAYGVFMNFIDKPH